MLQNSGDITPYSGERVRFAFYHAASRDSWGGSVSSGWYIDDLEISHYIPSSLQIDQNLSGNFISDGEYHYYVINTPPDGHLRIALDDLDNTGINELYIRHGALPTAGVYDYRYSNQGRADQEIFIPNATPGPTYILVYDDNVGANGAYTISASFSTGVIIEHISPASAGNSSTATITIDGGGFTPSSSVSLVQGAATIPAATVNYVNGTRLIADFNLIGVVSGNYQLKVQSGEHSNQTAFEVLSGGAAELATNLIVPSQVGYHTPATIWVEYTNKGTVSMKAPLLLVTAEQQQRQAAMLILRGIMPVSGFWTSAMPEGFSSTVQVMASGDTPGILQPGESKRVPVQFAGWQQPWDLSYSPITFKLGVLYADNTTTVDWASLKNNMKPSALNNEAWEPLWVNFMSQVGSTWGDYVSMLDGNAIYLGRLGRNVIDIGDLLAFEFAQADALNVVRTLAASIDAYVPAPGMDLVFARAFQQNISSRYKMGAFGRGWTHNWNGHLETASDGTVTVTQANGARRIFQPDSRPAGGYFAMEGDHGTLTSLGGGAFKLQETSGIAQTFLADGKLNYIEDTNGNRITAGYTGDLLTSLSHSSGKSLAIHYNAGNLIDSITDPDNRTTTFAYDPASEHLQSVTYFDGSVVTYTYSIGNSVAREHAITEISLPCCSHRYFSYDDRGRLLTASRDDGAETLHFSYDSAGMISVADAYNHASKYYLDNHGLLAKATDPLGNAVVQNFDTDFNLVNIIDPAGQSYAYDYDVKGRLISMTDPLGDGARFSYTGPFNRMTRLIDANGNVSQYGYDAKGNLASITYDDTTVETWSYDVSGNPISWHNRRGTPINYEFDASGRLTAKIYQDGSHVTYTYDGRGNLITATDATGTTQFQYDVNDRLTKITYPGSRNLSYAYNTSGRRASMTDQLGHRLDYHYDAAGRLEYITDENSHEIVRYHYDDAGRLVRKDLNNGVYTTFDYDAAGQLTVLSNRKPDNSILSQFTYTYDSRSRRTSMTTQYSNSDTRLSGTWEYEYDNLGQLIAWTAPDGRHVQYQYDALGNRTQLTDNSVTTDYAPNNMNQYDSVGNTSYLYDADGNLTLKIAPDGTTTYTYDAENRLTTVAAPTGTWNYTYDAFGNRVQVNEKGTVTDYVIDPMGFRNVVGEYSHATGTRIALFDHGFGLVSRNDSEFYTFDAVGNISELSSNGGTIENKYAYLPFGESLSKSENLTNPFQFVGEYGVIKEGNGLDFMRARYYDSFCGRFIANDPVGILGGDLNLLRYAVNDPINYLDPIGLEPYSDREIRSWGINPDAPGPAGYKTERDYYNSLPNGKSSTSDEIANDPNLDHIEDAFDYLHAPLGDYSPPFLPNPVQIFRKALADAFKKLEEVFAPLTQQINQPIPPISYTDNKDIQPTRPWDPNCKLGPAGYGSLHYIQDGSLMSYRVSFENEATATAPAQIVTVTDQLNINLDRTSFELTEIGFGDTRIAIPPKTQHFEKNVAMTYNGVDFEVQIEAGIHLETGEVYANFFSIDPMTGLPPTVDIGFLPPEDDTGRGQGYFTYNITNKRGLTTGSEIRNVANITFDYQDSIATNQVDPHDPSQGTDPEKECLNTIANSNVNLTAHSTAGGSVAAPGEGITTYDWGEFVHLTAEPSQGYEFVNWTGDVSTISDPTAADTSIGMYGDFSITANFKDNTIYDLDVDSDVDIMDIMMVAAKWNTATGDPNYNASCDLDGDGDIDIVDIMKVAAQWGWEA